MLINLRTRSQRDLLPRAPNLTSRLSIEKPKPVIDTSRVKCIHSFWMWRCCMLPCTQLKNLIHPDESPTYTLYCYRFSCRSVQLVRLVDGFWILTTLFAAFRNCRSVSNFTAQTHLCFPLSDDPVNRKTSQGKPVKYCT